MRDDNYLQGRLDYLWDRYFSDIEQKNDVRIVFGRKARSRLGSIKQSQADRISKSHLTISKKRLNNNFRNSDSGQARMTEEISYQTQNPTKPTIITINGLFKDSTIPEFLIDSVIAHEMVHYTHGFCSPYERKHKNPHAGGIIKKEMSERGLEDLFILQKKWLKENWRVFVEKNIPRTIRSRKPKKRKSIFLFR